MFRRTVPLGNRMTDSPERLTAPYGKHRKPLRSAPDARFSRGIPVQRLWRPRRCPKKVGRRGYGDDYQAQRVPEYVPGAVTAASDDLGWNGVWLRGYRYTGLDVIVPR